MASTSSNQCPTAEQLAAFTRATLTSGADEQVVQHLKNCESCEAIVSKLEQQPTTLATRLQTPLPADPYLVENGLKQARKLLLSPSSTAGAGATQQTQSPPPVSPVQQPPRTTAVPAHDQPVPSDSKSAFGFVTKVVAGGVVAAALAIGALALMPKKEAGETGPPSVTNSDLDSFIRSDDQPKIAVGFKQGSLSSDTPIEKVTVRLQVAKDSGPLVETVALHLGTGFPFRLYPLGSVERSPEVAAFPQRSSLRANQHRIDEGQIAEFEFQANPEKDGMDILKSSPALLQGLTVGDLSSIGIASRGESDWVLGGYEVLVNGQLLASHGELNFDVAKSGQAIEEELHDLLPKITELEAEIAELQGYVDVGQAEAADERDLKNLKDELKKISASSLPLASQLAGTRPIFRESSFTPNRKPKFVPKEVTLKMVTADENQPGSQNPLYLTVGAKKLPITSSANPLAAGQVQEFRIRPDGDIEKAFFQEPGIGMLASERRTGQVPDRANVQRLVVVADGETLYDSEQDPIDRSNLQKFWLIPPVHQTTGGETLVNTVSDIEVTNWRPGMKISDSKSQTNTESDPDSNPNSGPDKGSGTDPIPDPGSPENPEPESIPELALPPEPEPSPGASGVVQPGPDPLPQWVGGPSLPPPPFVPPPSPSYVPQQLPVLPGPGPGPG